MSDDLLLAEHVDVSFGGKRGAFGAARPAVKVLHDVSVSVARGEMQWRCTPETPWQQADYRLTVNTTLEDLAGNRVGRAFDVDKFQEVTAQIQTETVSIPFRIGN